MIDQKVRFFSEMNDIRYIFEWTGLFLIVWFRGSVREGIRKKCSKQSFRRRCLWKDVRIEIQRAGYQVLVCISPYLTRALILDKQHSVNITQLPRDNLIYHAFRRNSTVISVRDVLEFVAFHFLKWLEDMHIPVIYSHNWLKAPPPIHLLSGSILSLVLEPSPTCFWMYH